MHKITKLTRAKRNLIVEEVSKSYSNYKKYQNLATKYAIVNDRTKVFTSYNKIQQEIKKLLTELNGNYKYNPLHKPNLKPSAIANRLKTILLLFSKNNSESYWLDKAEQVFKEAIKLLYSSKAN